MSNYDVMMSGSVDGLFKMSLNGDKEVRKKKSSFEIFKQNLKNIRIPFNRVNEDFVKDTSVDEKEDIYSQFDVDTDHLY